MGSQDHSCTPYAFSKATMWSQKSQYGCSSPCVVLIGSARPRFMSVDRLYAGHCKGTLASFGLQKRSTQHKSKHPPGAQSKREKGYLS